MPTSSECICGNEEFMRDVERPPRQKVVGRIETIDGFERFVVEEIVEPTPMADFVVCIHCGRCYPIYDEEGT